MSSVPKSYVTPEQYLAIERKAQAKSEYFVGEMFAMAGASEPHNTIVVNVVAGLHRQFVGRPCKAYSTDMRVKVTATGLYTYPDVAAICGDPQFEDGELDTLLNPQVVVEVLSDSTEAYDRGKKFEHYRKLQSLREYVLIAQDRQHVEHYLRQASGEWLLTEYNNTEDTIELPSIECELTLAEIYDKVETPGSE